jgi:hypothetical protein
VIELNTNRGATGCEATQELPRICNFLNSLKRNLINWDQENEEVKRPVLVYPSTFRWLSPMSSKYEAEVKTFLKACKSVLLQLAAWTEALHCYHKWTCNLHSCIYHTFNFESLSILHFDADFDYFGKASGLTSICSCADGCWLWVDRECSNVLKILDMIWNTFTLFYTLLYCSITAICPFDRTVYFVCTWQPYG